MRATITRKCTDLIKRMQVWDQYGKRLGTVCRIFETGANDVLEVVSSSGEKTLIPFVMDTYIREVNLDRRKIEVDWFWLLESKILMSSGIFWL